MVQRKERTVCCYSHHRYAWSYDDDDVHDAWSYDDDDVHDAWSYDDDVHDAF
jgi:hypothetical protein